MRKVRRCPVDHATARSRPAAICIRTHSALMPSRAATCSVEYHLSSSMHEVRPQVNGGQPNRVWWISRAVSAYGSKLGRHRPEAPARRWRAAASGSSCESHAHGQVPPPPDCSPAMIERAVTPGDWDIGRVGEVGVVGLPAGAPRGRVGHCGRQSGPRVATAKLARPFVPFGHDRRATRDRVSGP